ncbi:MAG: PAS domain S-box protein, partial [Flavobacteriales bacterium]
RRAREIIRASEERFHLLADNVSQLVWMAEADGSSMWFNQRWTEFTGLTGEEIRMDARQLHHPDHFDRVSHSLKQRTAKAEPWEEQFPLKSRHGVYHWFLATAMPVRDEAGNVIRWFGTCTDITSQREAQERLQESEERFRLLADNIGQLAWIAEADGEINWYNKRWFDYSGTTLEEMRGWGWQKIHHPDHVEAVTRKFQEHIALEKDWQDTFPIRGADGEYRWFLSRAFPVRDAQGRVQRWFGTNTDITEQKLAEEALEEGARHKDHFLATLAHELRNPLAPLKNGLQLMELAPDDPEMLDRTRAMMARQLDHMVRLVDDLMDLSRISRGKIELLNQPVDLPAVLATAIESTKPLMDQRRHTLEVRIGKGPFPMNGDPARLTQVVANLLNNSAKYTPEQGRIELSMERSDDTVVITVSDNGIGIPVDSLEHVFDMFAQVDPAKQAREGGGLGIGLNIVQRLIHMHQGTVTAFSEGPRKGSTFTVRLPLHATPVDNTPAPVEQIGASGEKATWRVLVVDDNQDAAISMSMILRKQGHEVRTAHDGLEGVRLVEEFRPDVVFMDIGMPRMNGYEACVAIRNGPQGEDLYMVALSGWGQEEDRKKSEEAGFDQHVVKPIDRRTLDRLMSEARTRRSVSGSASLS